MKRMLYTDTHTHTNTYIAQCESYEGVEKLGRYRVAQ